MAIEIWSQRNGPSDCLPKTQVYANQQWEVYGLTPARCWKVKLGEIEVRVKMPDTRG